MSMLSSQCDRLREVAVSARLYGLPTSAVDAICDAADTIWALRNEGAENTKLREQSERLFDKTLELATDNAKLRELIWDMWATGMCECEQSDDCRDCVWKFPERMAELGIGAD